jgi:hypothetical protein
MTAALYKQAVEWLGEDKAEELAARHRDVVGYSAVSQLRQYRQLMLQMQRACAVDNYLSYLAELLSGIYERRPEVLQSGDQVSVEFVLQFATTADLRSALMERKVTSLSYRSLDELATELKKSMKFELFEKKVDLETAVLINALRNLIVHNRAVVNRAFLRRAPGFPGQLGQTLDFSADQVLEYVTFLGRSATDIDARAIAKFKLAPAQ